MKAFKLINTANGLSAFQEGTVPEMARIEASYFFEQLHVEQGELHAHPAPRYQFVITLKGRLKFTVSNGSFFILEPGILLIATDVSGPGHSWELLDGEAWQRVYIVPPAGAEDHFIISGDTGTIE